MAESAAIFLNLAVCGAGVFMCACRLAHMSQHEVKPAIRVTYILWLPTLVASALSWTAGEPPSIAQIALGVTVLTHLSVGYSVWRDGPPEYARRIS